jgi:hypothetical protein
MPSINELKATAWLWRLAIIKMVLFSLATLAGAWMTALNKLDWDSLAWDDRRNIIIGMFLIWSNVMIAFLDKSANQIATGHMPGLDDTVIPTDSTPITPPPVDPVAQPVVTKP